MLTTKEAIEKRRSIRKYKEDSIPDEYIQELLNAAQLAPSGCNAQPWRFKIIKETDIKAKLADASYDQTFIGQAPIVIVCCADIQGYLDGSVSGVQDLGKIGAIEGRIVTIIQEKIRALKIVDFNELGHRIAVNVAIAVEHIVLRALDFGLGTCWIRLFDEKKIKDLFSWGDNISVVALLPIGYPAEFPEPRKRLMIKDILMD